MDRRPHVQDTAAVGELDAEAEDLVLGDPRVGVPPEAAQREDQVGPERMGRMLRTIVLMTILVVVTTRDTSLGLQAAVVFGIAFTVELALSMISYLGGEAKTG